MPPPSRLSYKSARTDGEKKEVGQRHFAVRWDEEEDAKSWGRNYPSFPVSGFPEAAEAGGAAGLGGGIWPGIQLV